MGLVVPSERGALAVVGRGRPAGGHVSECPFRLQKIIPIPVYQGRRRDEILLVIKSSTTVRDSVQTSRLSLANLP